MKNVLLVSVAVAALVSAAPAQNMPTLTQFLSQCFRDGAVCRLKMKDYINAAVSQKSMCLPQDVSVGEAGNEMLHWLRAGDHPPALDDQPYDDALYAASQKLYPCAPPPPPPPPPQDQQSSQPQP